MKITKIETFQLTSKLETPFGWSQDWITNRSVGIVKVSTDEGIIGWGEGCGGPASEVVNKVLTPLLIGSDPLNRIKQWQLMFGTLYNANQAVGFGGSAISAIDIALWDIAGKYFNLPVNVLLGGQLRDKIAVYATGLYYTENELPLQLLAEARGYVDDGYLGVKTKVGGLPMAQDIDRVKAIRSEIGPEIHLMIDANQAYNAASAIDIGNRLYSQNLTWFEEPVNAQDVKAYLQVKDALPIAISGGENLRTRYEFQQFLSKRAYDIVQPDVINVGGISEMQNVSMTANTFGIQVNPHVWGSPIMIAATLHLASTLPPCPTTATPEPFVQEPVMEFDRTPSKIRDELCYEPLKATDGYLDVPSRPGLGVEVNETTLKQLTDD